MEESPLTKLKTAVEKLEALGWLKTIARDEVYALRLPNSDGLVLYYRVADSSVNIGHSWLGSSRVRSSVPPEKAQEIFEALA